MKPTLRICARRLVITLCAWVLAPSLFAIEAIIEAESGRFSGWIDRHSCWHNVMLTDAPHSTHSGSGVVDTPNRVGSFVEVAYDALRSGPHRVTVRYTHIKPDARPGQLWINGKDGPILPMPQNKALPAYNTDSAVVHLPQGRNLIRLAALAEGGLGNVDYLKVTELRDPAPVNCHVLSYSKPRTDSLKARLIITVAGTTSHSTRARTPASRAKATSTPTIPSVVFWK
jgi:hypothetical protein